MAASEHFTSTLSIESLANSQDLSSALFRHSRKTLFFEIVLDVLTSASGILMAYLISQALHFSGQALQSFPKIIGISLASSLAATILSWKTNAYRSDCSPLGIRDTELSLRLASYSILFFILTCVLFKMTLSEATFFIAFILIPLLLIAQKRVLNFILSFMSHGADSMNRAVIYGVDSITTPLVSTLLNSPRLGFSPVAVIKDYPDTYKSSSTWKNNGVSIQYGLLTPDLLRKYQCDFLIIAVENLSSEKLLAAASAAKEAGQGVVFTSAFTLQSWQKPNDFYKGSNDLINSAGAWPYSFFKRFIDFFMSLTLLVFLSPLLLLIALLIKLDSMGPALFVQKRVGKDERLFSIYKFRSMYHDSPQYDFSPTRSSDRRITRLGRFLRKTSLDELPQLINVLRGEMSLVGPRPEMPFIVQSYNSHHRQRLLVKPGITGLWQLSADRVSQIHENIHYDFYYIQNRTFFMDLAILAHTLLFAARGV